MPEDTTTQVRFKENFPKFLTGLVDRLGLSLGESDFTLFAFDIQHRLINSPSDVSKYFEECSQKGVMPYSCADLKVYSKIGSPIIKVENISFDYDSNMAPAYFRKILDFSIKGGKFRSLRFRGDGRFETEAFIREPLQNLVDGGYVIQSGDVQADLKLKTGVVRGCFSLDKTGLVCEVTGETVEDENIFVGRLREIKQELAGQMALPLE